MLAEGQDGLIVGISSIWSLIFLTFLDIHIADVLENSANLLVWDSIMPKMKKTYDDIRKQVEPYMNPQ